jgi:hypothetical protein
MLAAVLSLAVCLSKEPRAEGWDLKSAEQKEFHLQEERRVERTEKASLAQSASPASERAFREVMARLEQGHWQIGQAADPYWLPSERKAMLRQEEYVSGLRKKGKATYAEVDLTWEEGHPSSHSSLCCNGEGGTCGLYEGDGECCFYQLRHTCGPGNTSSITSLFSTSSGANMQSVAKALNGKTILIAGDSVSHQTFAAAKCDLHRHNFSVKTSTWEDWCEGQGNELQEYKSVDVNGSPQSPCCHEFERQGEDGGAIDKVTLRLCFLWLPFYSDKHFVSALSHADVVIFNLGLWYTVTSKVGACTSKLQAAVTQALTRVVEWIGAAPASDGFKRLGIFRGTLPQHFQGHGLHGTGAWHKNELAQKTSQCRAHDGVKGEPAHDGVAEVGPIPVGGKYEEDLCAQHAMDALGLHQTAPGVCALPVYYIPLSKSFAPRFDAHQGSSLPETRTSEGRPADCTHYCFFPRLWEIVWDRVHLALTHHKTHCTKEGGPS